MSKFVSVDKLLYFKQKLESLFTLKTNAIQTAIDNEVLARQTADNALDAELTDIRVGYDGTSYDSAGNAVRTQVITLNTKINDATSELNEKADKVEVSELKSDIDDLYISKITKFYASNLGETHIADSDNGKIQDMMIYGKSSQNGTPTPNNPIEIKSVVNPKLSVSNGDGSLAQEATLPYTLNAIPVTSGGNVTIDGQKYIADYVDIENKKLVRNVGIGDLGTLKPEHVTAWGIEKGVFRYSTLAKNLPPNFSAKINVITESYKSVGNVGSWKSIMQKGDNVIGIVSVATEWGFIIATSSFTDANSFKQAMQGVMLLYELATPTVFNLTDEEVQAFKSLTTYYPTTNISVNSEQLDGYTTFNYPISLANGWNYVKEQLGDTREYIYDMELQSAEAYVNSEYAVALTELEV